MAPTRSVAPSLSNVGAPLLEPKYLSSKLSKALAAELALLAALAADVAAAVAELSAEVAEVAAEDADTEALL